MDAAKDEREGEDDGGRKARAILSQGKAKRPGDMQARLGGEGKLKRTRAHRAKRDVLAAL